MAADDEADESGEQQSNYEQPPLIIEPPQGSNQRNSKELKDDPSSQRGPLLHRFKEWCNEHVTPINILTLVIAGAAWAQFHATQGQLKVMQGQLDEMKTSGQTTTQQMWSAIGNINWMAKTMDGSLKKLSEQAVDTHELAAKAGQQAEAAIRQAVASKIIAQLAVSQAVATQQLATAAQQSANISKDAMYFEQRPWVSVEFALTDNSKAVRTEGALNASSVSISAHNSGRTPALRWRYECCEETETLFEKPVPGWDELRKARLAGSGASQNIRNNEEISRQSEIVPPNVTLPISVITYVVNPRDKNYRASCHYMIGRFVYFDIIDQTREHITEFCLVTQGISQFRLCKSGQKMN